MGGIYQDMKVPQHVLDAYQDPQFEMDGKELEAENEEGDYTDSLHYRIN